MAWCLVKAQGRLYRSLPVIISVCLMIILQCFNGQTRWTTRLFGGIYIHEQFHSKRKWLRVNLGNALTVKDRIAASEWLFLIHVQMFRTCRQRKDDKLLAAFNPSFKITFWVLQKYIKIFHCMNTNNLVAWKLNVKFCWKNNSFCCY